MAIRSLEIIVDEILAEKPKALLDYRGGSKPALDRLVTEVMKRSDGRADPKKVRRMIINKL